MVFGRRATVQADKVDRYGRLVGKVTVGGSDVNVRQITAGMAWFYAAYKRELDPVDRTAYAEAENAVRQLVRQFWADAGRTLTCIQCTLASVRGGKDAVKSTA
jgi:endonuclease YncB( thermonuclease family)